MSSGFYIFDTYISFMIRIFLVIAVLLFLSCKDGEKITAESQTDPHSLDSLKSAKPDINLVKLSAEAERELQNFQDFTQLDTFMNTLHTSNAYFVRKYADSTDFLIQSLKENLKEEKLDINSIKSRTVVLATEAGLLKDLANSDITSSEEKFLSQKERLLIAYNSFIVQINEHFLAIPENIEKELLQDFKPERDTILDPN